MEELWQTDGAPVEGPRFRVVGRGYDRRQVDEYMRMLLSDAARPFGAEPVGRAPSPADQRLAAKDAPRGFDVALRGYARDEVDRYLEQFDR
jgi:cell division septum initiation protein DivIVA